MNRALQSWVPLAFVLWGSVAVAQSGDEAAETSRDTAESPHDTAENGQLATALTLEERAAQLEAFLAGELEEPIDPGQLLRLDLEDVSLVGVGGAALIEAIGAGSRE